MFSLCFSVRREAQSITLSIQMFGNLEFRRQWGLWGTACKSNLIWMSLICFKNGLVMRWNRAWDSFGFANCGGCDRARKVDTNTCQLVNYSGTSYYSHLHTIYYFDVYVSYNMHKRVFPRRSLLRSRGSREYRMYVPSHAKVLSVHRTRVSVASASSRRVAIIP